MNKVFIFLSTLLFITAGCNKESSHTENATSASVSIYAVVPDAPSFNFFLNGSNVAASVPFGSYTLYNHVNAGTVSLQAQSASRSIIIDTSFSTAENAYYSLFIMGDLSGIKPVVLHDSLPALTLDSCGMRFFVFSVGVTGIDFRVVTNDSAKTNISNWLNRGYGDVISSDTINTFKKLPAGTYSFYAISRANNKDTIAKFTNRSFSDSSNYTLMLEGRLAGTDTALMLGTRLHQ